MRNSEQTAYPLPVARALLAAQPACGEGDPAACYGAVLDLAGAITYYAGAVAIAQYSQALLAGDIEPDPTLSRSLRSLKRVLPGQWLMWAARGLAAHPDGPVAGMAQWYSAEDVVLGEAYTSLRDLMVQHMGYAGDYGPRESASPRVLLEMVDQYRIKRGKVGGEALPPGFEGAVAEALFKGLRSILSTARFMGEYLLFAPEQRHLLMGAEPSTPVPPVKAPFGMAEPASLVVYPPGSPAENLPLFPLDPLLVYAWCDKCEQYRVAALQEVVSGTPVYLGIDPECGHGKEAITYGIDA